MSWVPLTYPISDSLKTLLAQNPECLFLSTGQKEQELLSRQGLSCIMRGNVHYGLAVLKTGKANKQATCPNIHKSS